MSDDRAFLLQRIREYAEYTDLDERSRNDERVRAFTGERLAAARERLSRELDEATARALDAAIMECQFADMKYARTLEDADLDDATIAVIERAERVSAEELPALLEEIEAAFAARRAAVEAKAVVRASD